MTVKFRGPAPRTLVNLSNTIWQGAMSQSSTPSRTAGSLILTRLPVKFFLGNSIQTRKTSWSASDMNCRWQKPSTQALRSFDSAVNDAIYEMKHPQDSTRVHRAEVIFEPLPNEKLTPGPAHDLQSWRRKCSCKVRRS